MRWLMVVLLVSLVALLFAAAGLARYIWLQRTKLRSGPPAPVEVVEKSDPESNS